MKITNLKTKSFLASFVLASLVFISCDPNKGLNPNFNPDSYSPSGSHSHISQEFYPNYAPVEVIEVPDVYSNFNILHVNDTHGYIEQTADNQLAVIASFMDGYDVAQTLRVSNGDMFQGTGLSNLTHGRIILETMNVMEFDCMIVGNHEFDWGIETILGYFDGDPTNGEANFPLLAANIIDKNGNPLEYAHPYMIKEINGARIGVIGIIGETLESSISVKSLAGHQFTEARPAAERYSKFLKEQMGCNMVIVATHCGPESNYLYEGLDIDLILNSHTHRVEDFPNGYNPDPAAKGLDAKYKSTIPCIQSGSNSRAIGKVDTTVNYNDVTINSLENWCVRNFGSWATHIIEGVEPSKKIEQILASYKVELDPVLNSTICKATNGLRGNVARYTTAYVKNHYNETKLYGEISAAFVNGGGFRTDWKDEVTNVTYSKLLEMVPFENEMKVCKFKGTGLKVLADAILNGLNGNTVDIVSNSVFTCDENNNYYLDGVLIEDDKEYTLAVLDFVFDKSTYASIFKNAYDEQLTNDGLRDLLNDCLKSSNGVVDFASYN